MTIGFLILLLCIVLAFNESDLFDIIFIKVYTWKVIARFLLCGLRGDHFYCFLSSCHHNFILFIFLIILLVYLQINFIFLLFFYVVQNIVLWIIFICFHLGQGGWLLLVWTLHIYYQLLTHFLLCCQLILRVNWRSFTPCLIILFIVFPFRIWALTGCLILILTIGHRIITLIVLICHNNYSTCFFSGIFLNLLLVILLHFLVLKKSIFINFYKQISSKNVMFISN